MDMDWIVTKSKDILLETGEFPPCIFVEMGHTDQAIVGIPQIHEVDNAMERARIEFYAGRAFAQKKLKKQTITGVYQVAEIWYVAETVENMFKYGRATNHPQRKEGLSIAAIADVATIGQSMEQELQVYEILRPSSGSVDLVKDTMHDGETMTLGIGLPAFLAGARTAKQDISQAIHELRRTCERYNALIQDSRNKADRN